jgi:hypothetical protein
MFFGSLLAITVQGDDHQKADDQDQEEGDTI